MAETDDAWLELAQPGLMARARQRQAFYVRWVAEYDSLSWWGKLMKRNRDFVNASEMRRLSLTSLDEHIEYIEANG